MSQLATRQNLYGQYQQYVARFYHFLFGPMVCEGQGAGLWIVADFDECPFGGCNVDTDHTNFKRQFLDSTPHNPCVSAMGETLASPFGTSPHFIGNWSYTQPVGFAFGDFVCG